MLFKSSLDSKSDFPPPTADLFYDTIAEKLKTPEFLPRALFERFNLEVLSTTDSPLDSLDDIQTIRASGWKARILPTFRPDPVVDPEFAGFAESILKLGEQTGEDTSTWTGYLNALRKARLRFKALGCTSTDHGHLTAETADLPADEAAELFNKVSAAKPITEQQAFPGADAHRDGADESGRRPGDADSSGQRAQS